MKELTQRTLLEHGEALRLGLYSSEELVRAYLEQIEETDGDIGAYLTVCADSALETARAVDKRRMRGEALPLTAGIPFAVKDNLCTEGVRTTCASRMLENYIPPYTATAVQRLLSQGAVLLGKTNMDEFSMGSSTESSALGRTKNPIDASRVPGGSSGGSAAAVAAREAVFALGSDTGGSVRQPAAFCGVVGMSPTYSLVSRYGLVAFAPSLDRVGVLTRTAGENAAVLSVIAGRDPLDATSADIPRVSYDGLSCDMSKMRVAIPVELMSDEISVPVRRAVNRAAELFKALGAEVEEISLPSLRSALSAYYVISSAEASSNLARFDGVRYGRRAESYEGIDELYRSSRSEGLGAEVKRRIMLGTFALSSGFYDEYYLKALAVKSRIGAELDGALGGFDIILCPTAPTVAFARGKRRDDPTEIYAADLCTVPSSLAGLPALSLPFGADMDGMPIGVQLVGRRFSEKTLYSAARILESEAKNEIYQGL